MPLGSYQSRKVLSDRAAFTHGGGVWPRPNLRVLALTAKTWPWRIGNGWGTFPGTGSYQNTSFDESRRLDGGKPRSRFHDISAQDHDRRHHDRPGRAFQD